MLYPPGAPDTGADRTSASFFPTLRNLACVSLALLIGATYLNQAPWVATLGGVAPLVWYHAVYLTPRARRGLGQSAIDSVYYFGFLVTIAALGVSAVSIALSGGRASMDIIAYQFGLGLLATGYAVFARMHLTSISSWVDDSTPEILLDRYLTRTQELVTNVEMASEQFRTLATNLMHKTEIVTAAATEKAEQSMLDLARLFDQQLRQSLASGNEGLRELRSLVSDTSFAEEREALARSVKVTLECVVLLNKALIEFANNSGASASASEAVRSASERLSASLAGLSGRIEEVGGEQGTISRTGDAFADVQSRARRATEALADVVEELTEVGGSLGGVSTTFRNLKTLTSKAQLQLEALIQTSGQLDAATGMFARSAEKTHALANGFDRVAAALPGVGDSVQGLNGRLEDLRLTVSAVEQQLQQLPAPATQALSISHDLREALSSVHKVLEAAGSEARTLSVNTAEAVSHLEQSHKIATDITGLQDASRAVNELLSSMAANGARTTATLAASSEALERAVATATNSLDRDAQTASRAAALFTDRLATVAQAIIDETRRVRTA